MRSQNEGGGIRGPWANRHEVLVVTVRCDRFLPECGLGQYSPGTFRPSPARTARTGARRVAGRGYDADVPRSGCRL